MSLLVLKDPIFRFSDVSQTLPEWTKVSEDEGDETAYHGLTPGKKKGSEDWGY